MKLSLALLPLIGLAIRQSSAIPAQRGSNDHGDLGVEQPSTEHGIGKRDYYKPPAHPWYWKPPAKPEYWKNDGLPANQRYWTDWFLSYVGDGGGAAGIDGNPNKKVHRRSQQPESYDPDMAQIRRDTDSAGSDFWLGTDILGGDGADGVLKNVAGDIRSLGQDPESYGLGPTPGSGHWPGHQDQPSNEHEHHHEHEHHEHHHKHEHEHEDEHGHNHHDERGHGGSSHHSGRNSSGTCKQRDFTPQTRHFDWTLTYGQDAPDGFLKKRILINGQSPGPLIEANEGDTIVVKVKNFLDQGTSIHWHGMFQNSTPFMDGIAGFSQCPIPPGGHLTYRFKIEGQYGSYWWHSHSKMQYTDGLYGGLIIHSKRDPYQKCRDYDDERYFLFAGE